MTQITLSEPLKTGDGRLLKELQIRSPRVKDLKAAQRVGGTAAEQEIALLALLAGVVPEDLDELLVADYKRLQDTFRNLVGDGG